MRHTGDSRQYQFAAGDCWSAALLVDPEDSAAMVEAMQLIAESGDLQLELREKGYANVKQFTWESAAAKVLQTLEQAAVL